MVRRTWIELSSALQPIAIAYFVAVLVVRKSWRFQALLGAGILAGYGLVLAFIRAPGIAAGSYQYNHNLVHWVDIALLAKLTGTAGLLQTKAGGRC